MKPERIHQREYLRRWLAELTPAEREERRLQQRAYCKKWWRQRDRRAEKAAYNREWRRRLRDEEMKLNAAIKSLTSGPPHTISAHPSGKRN